MPVGWCPWASREPGCESDPRAPLSSLRFQDASGRRPSTSENGPTIHFGFTLSITFFLMAGMVDQMSVRAGELGPLLSISVENAPDHQHGKERADRGHQHPRIAAEVPPIISDRSASLRHRLALDRKKDQRFSVPWSSRGEANRGSVLDAAIRCPCVWRAGGTTLIDRAFLHYTRTRVRSSS